MKKVLAVFLVLIWMPFAPCSYGADTKAELQDLTKKIQTKVQAGKSSEADLADEIKGFDDLLAEHAGEKTDEVATILYVKAIVYAQVLHDDDKATAAAQKITTDFPDTALAKQADMLIANFAKMRAANEVQKHLGVGAPFPDFQETGLDGKPLSPANYKGKIVLIDFWATWCGPCVAELPNVKKVYDQYHDKGFEIIGVSLDKDKSKLTDFLKEKNIPWSQYFDGEGWQSKMAATYGITGIPATFLLDKDGNIIGKDLRGGALESAVSTALAAK